VATGAISFEGFFMFARHQGILRQFQVDKANCHGVTEAWRNQKKRRSENPERRNKDLQIPDD
jgi:hypothetical protein